ncbi:hypothetical protein Q765_17090 [Flavobacterium rivuli WB 3.3-2 = DSM 21788]|uniref:YdhG-like domain-containing protein n=1 Tax=Flavobacterium rivuli WB 3.3-2 = DSM 21788 TaxID=1121895 RepID=A0A0A2M1A4_9FLAO|nr:DUF1801 domain-containing protein [Flavobacterium rivuli]KGO85213.1 hypothetical protein Q765_17090 [Flavobacterium rivuli WB 3.3-2 = DSM 21788]
MQSAATSPQQYLDELPDDRKTAMTKLREVIVENLPPGFSERITYGMLGWVVPHETYPAGYHCTPELPLPFLSIASQKNFIALYTMSIYADKSIHDWFVAQYPNYVKTKLDMGKGCVRFKNINTIPYELIGQLVSKMTLQEWIDIYESNLKTK